MFSSVRWPCSEDRYNSDIAWVNGTCGDSPTTTTSRYCLPRPEQQLLGISKCYCLSASTEAPVNKARFMAERPGIAVGYNRAAYGFTVDHRPAGYPRARRQREPRGD